MECTSKECKRIRKRFRVIHGLINVTSESSLSSDSDTQFHPLKCLSRKNRKQLDQTKRDYLTRLFERKKLKEKSLSKKLKTPFDRKINRTCWPIELKKISKIKKRPREKRREKPTYRSLTKKSFSNLFIPRHNRENSPQITCSELEFFDDDSYNIAFKYLNDRHYLYEQIMPETLMEVLQKSEYLRNGATINMIIGKLRNMKLNLNPMLDQLKEEISVKLLCAIKLGMVTENNGSYRIADDFQDDVLSKTKINSIWDWWYRRMQKMRT